MTNLRTVMNAINTSSTVQFACATSHTCYRVSVAQTISAIYVSKTLQHVKKRTKLSTLIALTVVMSKRTEIPNLNSSMFLTTSRSNGTQIHNIWASFQTTWSLGPIKRVKMPIWCKTREGRCQAWRARTLPAAALSGMQGTKCWPQLLLPMALLRIKRTTKVKMKEYN